MPGCGCGGGGPLDTGVGGVSEAGQAQCEGGRQAPCN